MEALSGHDKVRTSIPSAGPFRRRPHLLSFSRIFSNNILNKTRQKIIECANIIKRLWEILITGACDGTPSCKAFLKKLKAKFISEADMAMSEN